MRVLLSSVVVALTWSTVGLAQEMSDDEFLRRFMQQPPAVDVMSDEEMLSRFRAQTEAVRGLQIEAEGGGQERGLVLAPAGGASNSVDSVGEVPEAGTAASAGSETTDALRVGDAAGPRFNPEIRVDIRINFARDSAAISPSEGSRLDQVCRVIRAGRIEHLRIIGHTDNVGSEAYNMRLSELRAQEVGRYLTSTCGISPAKLEMIGYGERFLSDPDDPGSARNRRVEFQALG